VAEQLAELVAEGLVVGTALDGRSPELVVEGYALAVDGCIDGGPVRDPGPGRHARETG